MRARYLNPIIFSVGSRAFRQKEKEKGQILIVYNIFYLCPEKNETIALMTHNEGKVKHLYNQLKIAEVC